ncbi:MAG: helix-turn-helix transcriptional regulator [Clostridiales bacterium]|nr:helix-turn-helix transcriptional regulator [Clostridiales bacterium]
MSNQNISRWERNEVLPNIDFCVKLARCYGVTLEELIGLNENQE